MDDSDETVCDDAEDLIISSQSQMSPSVLKITPTPRDRLNNVSQTNFTESESIITGHGSPEYLPPSAKIQRLASKEKQCIDRPAKSRVCNEVQSSQTTTANMGKTAAEKLNFIGEQEEKIEELMVLLESIVKRGVTPRETPIYAQIKHLMTTVKTQLADFTRYQQKRRQEIATCSNETQGSEDNSSSQWTSETKHKLLELANQQKELLKLFQRHKILFEKIQALKQKAKSVTHTDKHFIPAVEMHYSSKKGVNPQHEIADQTPGPTFAASNVNPLAVSTRPKTISNSRPKQFFDKHTSISIQNPPSSYTTNTQRPSAASKVTTLVDHPELNSHTPAPMSCNAPSVTQSLVTSSVTSQPRIQNVVLTGGQLYQVGDKQVYVLPQGLTTSVTSSLVVTQGAQTYQVQTAKPSFSNTSTTAVANKAMVTRSPTLNTVVTLPSSSWQHRITQTTTQLSATNAPLPSSCTTLPISASSLSDTSLPVSAVRSVSNSSALENRTLPTDGEISNHQSKQATNINQSDPISHTTQLQRTATVTYVHKNTRVQPQQTTPSQNTAGVQSSSQATKVTATVASKGPASQSRIGQTLQRRNSFGSDLPDLKTLLSHSVIEAGSNVISMQFEGRSFEASLRPTGLIESAGGETFRTPMAWMRAVTGSWNTVKQSQAYKMVHYKGRPLALFTIPSKEKDLSCDSRDKQNVSVATNIAQDAAGLNKTSKGSGLMTCWDDVARLLTDCKVIPISKNELVPTDHFLPADFWDSTNEVDIPQSVLEDLDF